MQAEIEREHSPVPGRAQQVGESALIKALAHPLRLRLRGMLATRPATATQLAVAVGCTSGTTSYHLRVLAAAGLISELPVQPAGRERVWWVPDGSVNIPLDQLGSDAATLHRAQAEVEAADVGSFYERVAADEEPPEWLSAVVDARQRLRLDAVGMAALKADLLAVLQRWAEVTDDAPGLTQDREVAVQLRVFPLGPAAPSASGG